MPQSTPKQNHGRCLLTRPNRVAAWARSASLIKQRTVRMSRPPKRVAVRLEDHATVLDVEGLST